MQIVFSRIFEFPFAYFLPLIWYSSKFVNKVLIRSILKDLPVVKLNAMHGLIVKVEALQVQREDVGEGLEV